MWRARVGRSGTYKQRSGSVISSTAQIAQSVIRIAYNSVRVQVARCSHLHLSQNYSIQRSVGGRLISIGLAHHVHHARNKPCSPPQ